MEKGVKEHTRSREICISYHGGSCHRQGLSDWRKCIKYQSSDFQSSGRSMCRGTVSCQRLWHSSMCGRITSGSVCGDEYDKILTCSFLTIEAARTHKLEHVYQAAMLDPHTGSELDIDTIKKMVDELIAAHGTYLRNSTNNR